MTHDEASEASWKQRYKRLQLSERDIEFYHQTPMPERQRNARWRKIDEMIFQDLKRSSGSEKKSDIQIITDSIEALNPADGKMYSSKSRYYQTLKDTGSHVIEKGEQGHKRELRGDYDNKQELRQALQQHLGRR